MEFKVGDSVVWNGLFNGVVTRYLPDELTIRFDDSHSVWEVPVKEVVKLA